MPLAILNTFAFCSDFTEGQVDLTSSNNNPSFKTEDKFGESEKSSGKFIEELRLKRQARRSQQLESVKNINSSPTENGAQPESR